MIETISLIILSFGGEETSLHWDAIPRVGDLGVIPPVVVRKSDIPAPTGIGNVKAIGYATLEAVFQKDGRIGEVRVAKPLSDKATGMSLTEEAVKTLCTWTFIPGQIDGRFDDVRMIVNVWVRWGYGRGGSGWVPSFDEQLGILLVDEPAPSEVFPVLIGEIVDPERIRAFGFQDASQGMMVELVFEGNVCWHIEIAGEKVAPCRFKVVSTSERFDAVFEPDSDMKLRIVKTTSWEKE